MAQVSNLYRLYRLSQEDRIILGKNLIFAAICIAGAALSSLLTLAVLRNFSWNILISDVVLWLVLYSVLVIYFLLARWKYLWWCLLLVSIAFLLPAFLSHQFSNYYVWLLVVSLFISLSLSAIAMKKEANSLIHLNWMRIIKKGSWWLSLSIFIVVGYLIYFSSAASSIDYNKALDYFLGSVNQSNILPIKYNLSGTVDDLIKDTLESQLNFSRDRDADKIKQAVNQLLISQVRRNWSSFFGFPLTGKEKLSSVLVKWAQQKWLSLSSRGKLIVASFLILLAVNIVGIFNFFFCALLFISSWIIKNILLLTKAVKIKRIGVEQEVLTIV